MNATTTTERQLLEQAAQAVGFEYMFYAPHSYHLRSGLLCSSPNGRTRAWNPLVDDADLLQFGGGGTDRQPAGDHRGSV